MNRYIVALVSLVAAVIVALAAARGPDPNGVPSADEVNSRVMSPFCVGLSLEECPSQKAAALRGDLSAKVAAGWTNRRIDAWLVSNYGQEVLGRPPRVTLWLVLTVAAAIAAVGLTRSWTRKPATAADPRDRGRDPSPEMVSRIQREIAEMRVSE